MIRFGISKLYAERLEEDWLVKQEWILELRFMRQWKLQFYVWESHQGPCTVGFTEFLRRVKGYVLLSFLKSVT